MVTGPDPAGLGVVVGICCGVDTDEARPGMGVVCWIELILPRRESPERFCTVVGMVRCVAGDMTLPYNGLASGVGLL